MKPEKEKIIKIIAVFTITFLIMQFVAQFYIRTHFQEKKQILSNISADLAQDFQSRIMKEMAVLNTAELMLNITEFDEQKIMNWLPELYNQEAGYSCVQVAPKGVVSYIYPIEGNEKAIGHDLLNDPKRKAGALKAIEEKQLTFIGPVTLIQNGKQAIIVRKPIFIDDKFWGFTIVLFDITKVIKNSFTMFEDDISFLLTGDNPDSKAAPTIYQSKDFSDTWVWKNTIKLPTAEWTLKSNYHTEENKFLKVRLILYFAGFFIALFILFLLERYAIQKEKNIELEQKNAVLATAVTANHEINQPLTVIKLRLALLKDELTEEQKINLETELSKIDFEIDKIAKILKQLAELKEIHFENYSESTKMVSLDRE